MEQRGVRRCHDDAVAADKMERAAAHDVFAAAAHQSLEVGLQGRDRDRELVVV